MAGEEREAGPPQLRVPPTRGRRQKVRREIVGITPDDLHLPPDSGYGFRSSGRMSSLINSLLKARPGKTRIQE